MAKVVRYFTILILAIALSSCDSETPPEAKFFVNGNDYSTDSFEKAQEQAVFKILKPDFKIIDPEQKALLFISGTMMDSIKSEDDRDVDIRYASESNICCLEGFTLEHEQGSYDIHIFETDRNFMMPVLNVRMINGIKFGYESVVRDGIANNSVMFMCAGVFVHLTAYGGDIEKHLELTKSMLPDKC